MTMMESITVQRMSQENLLAQYWNKLKGKLTKFERHSLTLRLTGQRRKVEEIKRAEQDYRNSL